MTASMDATPHARAPSPPLAPTPSHAPAADAAPAGAVALTLPCGSQLWLLPERAVAWPQAGMAFVADVHFGKAGTFRRAGQPVPHGTTADNLARLDAVLAATGAGHLVFLGDFLHARGGAVNALWDQLLPWRARHAPVRMTLVRGNHDLHAGSPPAALGLDVVDEPWQPVPGRPVLACHHPQPSAGHTVLAGHLHPALQLRGPGRDVVRAPCFGWGSGQLILPAFGAFTGAAPTALPRGWAQFAVTPARVVPVPAGFARDPRGL